jgi:hypothetical protein
MVRSMSSDDPGTFMVMLDAYYILGERHEATGLTVSARDTPGLVQTTSGFECDARFPDHGGGTEPVRVVVRLEDVIAILPLG